MTGDQVDAGFEGLSVRDGTMPRAHAVPPPLGPTKLFGDYFHITHKIHMSWTGQNTVTPAGGTPANLEVAA